MANDFDQFPVWNPLVRSGTDRISNDWSDFMSSFYMNLIGYLTQYGILIPQLTTEQRDAIQSPVEGQIIYHIDATPGPPGTRVAQLEVWQVKADNGSWRTITTT